MRGNCIKLHRDLAFDTDGGILCLGCLLDGARMKCFRRVAAVATVVVTVGVAGLGRPDVALAQAGASPWRDYCNSAAGRQHFDLRIGGCTAMLGRTDNAPADIAAFLTNRGTAYGELGDFDLALGDFRTALTLVPQRPGTLVNRAIVHRRRGDLDAALADINRYIAVSPDSIDGLTERCRILAVQGEDLAAAEADCNTALTQSPGLWYAHRNRAMVRLRQGRLDAALADFDAAEAGSASVSALALYGRGVIKVKRGQTAEGEADMARATGLTPYLPSVFLAYGLPGEPEDRLATNPDYAAALAGTEDRSFQALAEQCEGAPGIDAIAACTALLRRGTIDPPQIPLLLELRGGQLMQAGRFIDALGDLNHALELVPASAFAYSRRAYIRLLQDRLDDGVSDASRAVSTEDDAYSRWVRAELYFARKDYARAVSDLDEAIRFDAETAGYYALRGDSWLALESYARAVADFDTAIRLEPGNASYLNSRCWARSLQGRQLDLALADCEASLKIVDDPNTLDSRASVKLQMGDFAGAFADYDAAFTREPGFYGSQYGRGLARIRLGQVEAGRRDIAAALAARADADADFKKMGQTP